MCIFLLRPAAAYQSARDGEDESGTREEEMLLGSRGTQGKGLGIFLEHIKKIYFYLSKRNDSFSSLSKVLC